MQRNVGIYRDEAGLTAARRARSRTLKRRASATSASATGRSGASTPAGTSGCDLRNMLVCAEAIARAALRRTESRGAHSRLDFPEPSDEWGRAQHRLSARDGDGWRSRRGRS